MWDRATPHLKFAIMFTADVTEGGPDMDGKSQPVCRFMSRMAKFRQDFVDLACQEVKGKGKGKTQGMTPQRREEEQLR